MFILNIGNIISHTQHKSTVLDSFIFEPSVNATQTYRELCFNILRRELNLLTSRSPSSPWPRESE